MTIRTLDAGGDKAFRGLSETGEANPFLGLRGLRLSLRRPDVFTTQLRALARAAVVGDLKVMLPMVTAPHEFVAASALFHRAVETLRGEGAEARTPELGMMVEVPAAALIDRRISGGVFFDRHERSDAIRLGLRSRQWRGERAVRPDELGSSRARPARRRPRPGERQERQPMRRRRRRSAPCFRAAEVRTARVVDEPERACSGERRDCRRFFGGATCLKRAARSPVKRTPSPLTRRSSGRSSTSVRPACGWTGRRARQEPQLHQSDLEPDIRHAHPGAAPEHHLPALPLLGGGEGGISPPTKRPIRCAPTR